MKTETLNPASKLLKLMAFSRLSQTSCPINLYRRVVHNLEQGNPLVDRRIQHGSTTSLFARFCLSPSGTLGGSSSNPLLVLLKGYSFVLVTVGASQVSHN